ncbi:transducin/WD40 repeat-like superfamily protein [Actinidia rufa]|uniref:Transducin/WD40 repeat-like superfamily protein n=1 Tax=Actinidia rufa TaxID=165716 RepID=A0A7J0ER27_9ERIC|nr:transducin/WD40 repeat-like superfamily protein [Actinidia rufa]
MSLVAGSYERFIWGFKLKALKHSHESLTLTPSSASLPTSPRSSPSPSPDPPLPPAAPTTPSNSTTSPPPQRSAPSPSTRPPSLPSPSSPSAPLSPPQPHLRLRRRRRLRLRRRPLRPPQDHTPPQEGHKRPLGPSVGETGVDGGERLVLGHGKSCERTAELLLREDARLVFELDNQRRVLCAAPGTNGLLFTGGEDRGIKAWDTTSGKVAHSIEDAHSARVKGIVVLAGSDAAAGDGDPYMVASASSDGVIRVWDIRTTSKEKPNPLAEACTKSRLTCLAGSSLKSVWQPKLRKNSNDKQLDTAAEDL